MGINLVIFAFHETGKVSTCLPAFLSKKPYIQKSNNETKAKKWFTIQIKKTKSETKLVSRVTIFNLGTSKVYFFIYFPEKLDFDHIFAKIG